MSIAIYTQAHKMGVELRTQLLSEVCTKLYQCIVYSLSSCCIYSHITAQSYYWHLRNAVMIHTKL